MDYQTTMTTLVAGSNPYMLFEFDAEVLVRIVKLKLLFYDDEYPSAETEIRLGSSMSGPTDFSQLELIGTFDNPQPYEMRMFTVEPPRMAKFLAILEKDGTDLSFTFIEVFP